MIDMFGLQYIMISGEIVSFSADNTCKIVRDTLSSK